MTIFTNVITNTCKRPYSVISLQLFALPPLLPAWFLPYMASCWFHLFSTLNSFFPVFFSNFIIFFLFVSFRWSSPGPCYIHKNGPFIWEKTYWEISCSRREMSDQRHGSLWNWLTSRARYVRTFLRRPGNCSNKLMVVDLFFATCKYMIFILLLNVPYCNSMCLIEIECSSV